MTEKEHNVLWRFFSNPIVGLIGSIASIAGLILAFYFFFASKIYPDLTFYIHPVRATIVKMDQASRLAVRLDNKDIKQDITAVQIAVWNRGNKPIRTHEVLEPIYIHSSDGTPILEARIVSVTRDVVGMTLDRSELDKGKVGMSWKILEEGDGSSIQLIYGGIPETHFKMKGAIEGQKSISEFQKPIKIQSAEEQYRQRFRPWWEPLVFAVGSAVIGIYFIIKIIIRVNREGIRTLLTIKPLIRTLTGLFFAFMFIYFSIAVLVTTRLEKGPPFGF